MSGTTNILMTLSARQSGSARMRSNTEIASVIAMLVLLLGLLLAGCSSEQEATPKSALEAFEKGNFHGASQQFALLERRHADDPRYPLLRARALLEMNDPYGAEQAVQIAGARGGDAVQLNLLMAEIRLRQEKYDDAQALIEQIPAQYEGQKLRLGAEIYERKGEANLAHDEYQKALERDPNDGRIMIGLGRTYLLRGQLAKAHEIGIKAEKAKPYRVAATILAGEALVRMDKLEPALKVFNRALKFDPNNWDALARKADILDLLERYPEMKEVIDRIAKVTPTSPALSAFRGKYHAGRLEWSQAHNAFQAAGDYINYDPRTLRLAGKAAASQGLNAIAINYYERAVRMRPDLKDYAFELVELLYKTQRYEQALRLLDNLKVPNVVSHSAVVDPVKGVGNQPTVVMTDLPKAVLWRSRIEAAQGKGQSE